MQDFVVMVLIGRAIYSVLERAVRVEGLRRELGSMEISGQWLDVFVGPGGRVSRC